MINVPSSSDFNRLVTLFLCNAVSWILSQWRYFYKTAQVSSNRDCCSIIEATNLMNILWFLCHYSLVDNFLNTSQNTKWINLIVYCTAKETFRDQSDHIPSSFSLLLLLISICSAVLLAASFQLSRLPIHF